MSVHKVLKLEFSVMDLLQIGKSKINISPVILIEWADAYPYRTVPCIEPMGSVSAGRSPFYFTIIAVTRKKK
jgi:hypothetical protein